MGLDMYLEGRKHLYTEDNDPLQDLLMKMYGLKYKPSSVSYELGYWRKFNALHALFQRKLTEQSDKEEECGSDTWVSDETFNDIVNILKEISKDHNKAEELMPPSEGFFFGSTEYDDYYYEQLEKTITLFEKIIKEGHDLYYSASW